MVAKFTALEKSLVGNELVEEGKTGIVLPEGTLPGPNMLPENDEAKALVAEYEASNAARVASMQSQFGAEASKFGDPAAFAAAIGQAVAEALAAAGISAKATKATKTTTDLA